MQQKHILGKDGRAIPSRTKVAYRGECVSGPITLLNITIFYCNCVSSLFARVCFGSLVVSVASDLRRVFLAAALFRGIDLAARDYVVVRFAFTSLYMSVVRLLPYYFGTVYRPTLNLQVFLNGLSRKLQPVFSYGGYLNYQARESRKGLLNQHSQRPTLYWLQMESLKTCTHDICWSDLF